MSGHDNFMSRFKATTWIIKQWSFQLRPKDLSTSHLNQVQDFKTSPSQFYYSKSELLLKLKTIKTKTRIKIKKEGETNSPIFTVQ